MDPPGERRKSAKPTVGNVWIEGAIHKGLLTLKISDDGRADRVPPEVSPAMDKDLKLLRSRLVMENADERGKKNPSLVIQIPAWYNIATVIPVRTAAGVQLVPLSVVSEVYRSVERLPSGLEEVRFERRGTRGEDPGTDSGLVLQLGSWRGVLRAEILGSHLQVIPIPADPGDPPWVIARATDGAEARPVVHPLPFMELEGDLCLFPSRR
jgi:hypothetical protein